MRKRMAGATVSRAGRASDEVSMAEALSEQYRLDFAGSLFQLEGDANLNREQKLIILGAIFDNILRILLRLFPTRIAE
jgi:hypothetical protein